MPSEDNIVVSALSRLFADKCVVDNVSFSVGRGQILGLLGPNGAGKSTTLQMLSGALAPSSGEIFICGVDLLAQPKLAKSRMGFLPEIPPLYPEFTVDDYLRFCARIRQISSSLIRGAISDVKGKCGLSDVGTRLIGNLSKGYQQRVGIAQAIIHNPDVVILDEPTVGLDPIQIREIRELIKTIGREQSVILSSHILPEIQSTCDSVQIINHGRVVFNDTVKNLQQHMESPSLLVGLKNPPPLQQIEQLDSILKVERMDDKQIRVHHNQTCDTAQLLVESSVAKNWGLYHISAEQRSLEQIFVDITTTEPVADNSATDAEADSVNKVENQTENQTENQSGTPQ